MEHNSKCLWITLQRRISEENTRKNIMYYYSESKYIFQFDSEEELS